MDELLHKQLRSVLDTFLRRKKFIIICLLLGLVGGVAVYLYLPKVYRSTALLAYKQQNIGSSSMSPDQRSKFSEILSTFSNQITSRNNLQALIEEYDLYPELRGEMGSGELVALLRENLSIGAVERGDFFRLSYDGEDPQTVQQVVNALAAKFIAENLRYREEWATDNLAYIEDELQSSKETLDQKEALMTAYKQKHYNELPEQRETNIQRLNSLQNQQQHLQDSLQDLERTRILVQEQISQRRNMLAGGEAEDFGLAWSDDRSDLGKAQMQLESLQARYTDRHPDIVRLKLYIGRLQSSGLANGQSGAGAGQGTGDPQLERLDLQLKEIDLNMENLRAEQLEVKEQIKRHQAWVDAAPLREAEWTALTRDYNEYRKYHENLVARRLEAESAENRERRQRGNQFAVIEQAGLPTKPVKPSFLQVLLAATVLGLGLGGGAAYLLEMMDTSFKDAGDLESYLGLPVACAVPLIHTASEERRNRFVSAIWTVVLLASFVSIAGGIVYLWTRDYVVI